MLRFVAPLVLILATSVNTIQDRSAMRSYSAASESQIEFAIENNYDDTGPGAKVPDNAYKTYKTLEEALVGYIDDPDTQLPESERIKAISSIINTPKQYQRYNPSQTIREHPKDVAEYTGYRHIPQIPPINMKKYTWPEKQVLYRDPSGNMAVYDLRGISMSNVNSVAPRERPTYKLENIRFPSPVRGHASSGYYPYALKINNRHQYQFSTNPQLSYAYDVQDKVTGDLKSAQKTRDGGAVRGFYTFRDADGKTRTVHYTADENWASSNNQWQNCRLLVQTCSIILQ